ncbi:hypothetical protein EDB19DRAFT_1779515 [Suillus lakei]|nr:hypothetical protein EDB19DRAFT_1779515 [Suillus lakei]
MFMLRTYAIWGRSRKILIILIAISIPGFYIIINYNNSQTISEPPVPNITSCYNVGESRIIVAAYVLLVVRRVCLTIFFTEILVFTLYRSIKHYRDVARGNHLLSILIQHNILYFICGLVFSLLVMLSTGLLPFVYGDLFSKYVVCVGVGEEQNTHEDGIKACRS